MPIRFRGHELKAIRKAMGLTMSEFAKRLDEKTAPETISRWESEAQPMGGYVEKLVRLVACEALTGAAPGVSYNAGMIAGLKLVDPWLADSKYEVPYIHLEYTRMKEQSGNVAEVYADYKEAA
jgi:transcriptional regulator with XRE-family HTH domain